MQDEQVGHLPRVIASVIAPLMDDGSLFLEGVIPRGSKNVYKIPLKLLCFAKEGQEDRVMGRLRGGGLYVSGDYAAESIFEVGLHSEACGSAIVPSQSKLRNTLSNTTPRLARRKPTLHEARPFVPKRGLNLLNC